MEKMRRPLLLAASQQPELVEPCVVCVYVCVSSVAVECSCVHEAAESGVYSTLYLGPESRVRDGAYLNTSVTCLDWDFASSQSPNHATIFQVGKCGNGLNTNNSLTA